MKTKRMWITRRSRAVRNRDKQTSAAGGRRRKQFSFEPLEQRCLLATTTFELSTLQVANGGDGTAGVVYNGHQNIGDPGTTVNSAGDVNNDDFDDFLFGAPGSASAGNGGFSGQTYVVFGTDTGLPAEVSLGALTGSNGFIIAGFDGFDNTGSSAASAGDINNDGFDDIVIGGPPADKDGDNIFDDDGQAFVVFGGTTFPAVLELSSLLPANGGDGTAGFVLNGITNEDRAGTSVSSAGDFNDDGIDDIVIGAANAAGNNGEAYVFYGKTTPFDAVFELYSLLPPFGDGSEGLVIGNHVSDVRNLGTAVSSAGDFNDDGIDDIVLGAPTDAHAFVVFGSASHGATFDVAALPSINGGDGSLGFAIHGIADTDRTGEAVSFGDVNNDGIHDVIIGAPQAERDASDDAKGETYVVLGRADVPLTIGGDFMLSQLLPINGGDGSEGSIIRGIDFGDESGGTVSSGGDVDGDTVDDIFVGAQKGSPNGTTPGQAYLVYGSPSLPAIIDLATANGLNATVFNGIDDNERTGESVAMAGDVNNDGFGDLVIGAPGARPGTFEAGRGYLVYGGLAFNRGSDPIAVDDDAATQVGVPIDISVLDNDSPSALLDIIDFTQASDGTVSDNGDGTLRFTPTGPGPVTTFDYTVRLKQVELNASDPAAPDWFGYAVAVDGDTAVVGAKLEDEAAMNAGAVYVYKRAGTVWNEVAKLTASDAEANDQFGHAVAIDGTTIVVGAWIEDSNNVNAGAAYIFDETAPNTWTETAKIIGSDTTAGDKFGYSVDVSFNRVVVGALDDDPSGSASGAAYIFERNLGGANNWGERTKLIASDGAAIDKFGNAVTVSGGTVVVGAYLANAGAVDTGAVYVFGRNEGGADNWGEVKKIVPSDAAQNDQFGYSVSLAGNRLAIGNWLDDFDQGPFVSNAGSLRIHQRGVGGANNWGEIAKKFASDPGPGDRLGASVAIEGDRALAGAEFADDGFVDSGAAYVFERDQGGAAQWGQVTRLTDPTGRTNDKYGVSVSLSGNIALIGSFVGDSATVNNSGTAHVQDLRTDTATVTVNIQSPAPRPAPAASSDLSGELETAPIDFSEGGADELSIVDDVFNALGGG